MADTSPRPSPHCAQIRNAEREEFHLPFTIRHSGRAFSRADLLVVIAVTGFLGCWFGFRHLGERGRIARCAANLETLGQAVQSYANDHKDGIPAAGIRLGDTTMSWDTDLFPYLRPDLAETATGAYEKRELMLAVKKRFLCPSDPVPRGGFPRSYSMSSRSMKGWPPTADDETGVGAWWDSRTVSILGADKAQAARENPKLLPELKQCVLSDPANTLWLTELVARGNVMANLSGARVGTVAEQQKVFKDDRSHFHFGKFNYLMADGHVELLTGLQTGGMGPGVAGIWTIKAGD